MYLTQAVIADNPYMRLRVASCAAQEGCTEKGIDPDAWAADWRRVWASAPGWDAAWESAMVDAEDGYDPGSDPAVITDGMILGQVQAMMPFTLVEHHKPVAVPAE